LEKIKNDLIKLKITDHALILLYNIKMEIHMEFEWDDHKNQTNIIKHKIDFADAVHVFIDKDRIERQDTRNIYNEQESQ
jgi:hypothetical protein